MYNIAIFASGSGTNAVNFIQYFNSNKNDLAKVALVICNKKDAPVIEKAKNLGVEAVLVNREEFSNESHILGLLKMHKIDFIVLAGFLWLIPKYLVAAYPHKIVNVHPALLPKYGGKGMYGTHVHQQVINNKDLETGITIHYVDEHYDEGDIIFQRSCPVNPNLQNADEVAQCVHALEYEHYPRVVEDLLLKL